MRSRLHYPDPGQPVHGHALGWTPCCHQVCVACKLQRSSTPAELIQAEDRAHRIGQTSELNVHYYLCPNSIDNIIWPMVINKMRLLGEIFEGNASTMDVEDSSMYSMSALEALQDSDDSMIEIAEVVR